MVKRFGIIGAAGYVAPRHFKAIFDTGNEIVAAYDKSDSVGQMDQYFPQASFFTEFERFDRHIDKIRRAGAGIDFLSVCSPNYLHDAHIRFGLKNDCDVICEKPLVLNPWNVEALQNIEKETGCNVYTILQLRLHPAIIALKQRVSRGDATSKYEVDLTYITARGQWYYASWKGDPSRSGGIATNIGIHFFDMLIWIFGDVVDHQVNLHAHDRAAGVLELQKAKIRWFLSINQDTLPEEIKAKGKNTYRSLTIDQEEVEFSHGFSDLHTNSYQKIIAGEGFKISETTRALHLVSDIRSTKPVGLVGEYHPFCRLRQSPHPFYRQSN
jgi:UDP-N-acetyl-2-amino-2-deoxyglucuronate dehydrogenase